MYTPQRLVAEHKEMGEKCDWYIYENLRSKVNDDFIQKKDWNGLINFYDEVLDLAGISDKHKKVLRGMDFAGYETELGASLKQALGMAYGKDEIKAIYFEYECGQANFFLCDRFEKKENSDWAAYFDDVIEAPELEPEVDFLDDDDLPNWHYSLITQYIDARICASLGKCISKFSIGIPLAMGEHDHEVIYF